MIRKTETSTDDIKAEIEQKVSNIAGADIKVSTGSAAMGSMGGNGYTVNIIGDDSDTLKMITDDLMENSRKSLTLLM